MPAWHPNGGLSLVLASPFPSYKGTPTSNNNHFKGTIKSFSDWQIQSLLSLLAFWVPSYQVRSHFVYIRDQLQRTGWETLLNTWMPCHVGSAYGGTLGCLWCVRMVCWGPTSLADADSLNWKLAWQPRQVNVFPPPDKRNEIQMTECCLEAGDMKQRRKETSLFQHFGGGFLASPLLKKQLHKDYLIFVFKKSEQLVWYNTLAVCTSVHTLGKDHYNPLWIHKRM